LTVLLILCLVSVAALADLDAPAFAFSPELVQGGAGRISFAIEFGTNGFAGTISRGLGTRIDIAASVLRDGRFDLAGRLLAVDLPPLGILIIASFREFAIHTRLSLGPVRLDLSRAFGDERGRRLTLSAFPTGHLFLLAGWEEEGDRRSAFLGLRVNPGEYALLGVFLILGQGCLTLGFGGAF